MFIYANDEKVRLHKSSNIKALRPELMFIHKPIIRGLIYGRACTRSNFYVERLVYDGSCRIANRDKVLV